MIKPDTERILFAADLAGTLFFAVEGATAATAGQFDLLGVIVLAFATRWAAGLYGTCCLARCRLLLCGIGAMRRWHLAAGWWFSFCIDM